MAAVVRLPGVFEQIKLVAGVRWLILKNGLRRKHNVWDLIAMIWVAFCTVARSSFRFSPAALYSAATSRLSAEWASWVV